MYTTTHVDNRCIVQITKRKNRLKVYKSTGRDQVFLENEEEFEIEIFNPKQCSVLAKISINGISLSSSGIVIRPGQRVFLERFLDSKEKFKFSTYEVDDSPESKNAIELNGIVKVEFFDEYSPNYTYYTGLSWTTGGTTINNLTNLTGTISGNSFTATSLTSDVAGSLILSAQNCTTYTAGVESVAYEQSDKSIETGRIEKGSKSDQEFSYTSGNFNFFTSQIVEYRISPSSQKPVEISEIRNYCTQCGVRNKKNWKFCPSCGNKF